MTSARPTLVVLALSIAASLPLVARGNAVTVRLDITGGALTKPLAVTNPDLLDRSNVYAGTFLGPVTDAMERTWPRYVVSFVVEARTAFPLLARTGVPRAYVVHYATNPETGEGFLYLPGRGEGGYRGNIGLIIRDGHDGRWHRADPTWAELLNAYLPQG